MFRKDLIPQDFSMAFSLNSNKSGLVASVKSRYGTPYFSVCNLQCTYLLVSVVFIAFFVCVYVGYKKHQERFCIKSEV